MHYNRTILLKDGRTCLLRNATVNDGQAALDNFILAHTETDNLLTYPDEITFSAEEEAQFLQKKADSDKEIEILAEIGGRIVGTAGIEQISPKIKLRHRCEFGVSIEKGYWGLGIGKALLDACIACARQAGYEQIELDVIAENSRAVKMYENAGFVIYGRNPRGFRSRNNGYQELLYMRLAL